MDISPLDVESVERRRRHREYEDDNREDANAESDYGFDSSTQFLQSYISQFASSRNSSPHRSVKLGYGSLLEEDDSPFIHRKRPIRGSRNISQSLVSEKPHASKGLASDAQTVSLPDSPGFSSIVLEENDISLWNERVRPASALSTVRLRSGSAGTRSQRIAKKSSPARSDTTATNTTTKTSHSAASTRLFRPSFDYLLQMTKVEDELKKSRLADCQPARLPARRKEAAGKLKYSPDIRQLWTPGQYQGIDRRPYSVVVCPKQDLKYLRESKMLRAHLQSDRPRDSARRDAVNNRASSSSSSSRASSQSMRERHDRQVAEERAIEELEAAMNEAAVAMKASSQDFSHPDRDKDKHSVSFAEKEKDGRARPVPPPVMTHPRSRQVQLALVSQP
jgi:hypothetical protein